MNGRAALSTCRQRMLAYSVRGSGLCVGGVGCVCGGCRLCVRVWCRLCVYVVCVWCVCGQVCGV